MDELVKELAACPVQTLTSEPPDLDEIFLSYYGATMATEILVQTACASAARSMLWWALGIFALDRAERRLLPLDQ